MFPRRVKTITKTVSNDQNGTILRERLRTLQKIDSGLENCPAAPLHLDTAGNFFGAHITRIVCVCIAKHYSGTKDIPGFAIAGNCPQAFRQQHAVHRTGGIQDNTKRPSLPHHRIRHILRPCDIGCAALTTALTCIGSMLFQRRKLIIKPPGQFHIPWNWRLTQCPNFFNQP